jgi:hypothetical protein
MTSDPLKLLILEKTDQLYLWLQIFFLFGHVTTLAHLVILGDWEMADSMKIPLLK